MRGEVAPAREAHKNCLNLLSGSADISKQTEQTVFTKERFDIK